MNRFALLLALALPAVAQEKVSPYKFTKGEVAKYDVSGELRISLKGSHGDFIPGGHEEAVVMKYAAIFENTVTDVMSDETATITRQVRTLAANGKFQGKNFKFEWNRDKDKDKPAGPDEGPDTIAGLFRTWCTQPLTFTVSSQGDYACGVPNYDQLVNKAGAMYWLVGRDGKPWTSTEKLAAPLLHDKIILEFKNEFLQTRNEGGRKLMVISATPSIKGSELPPPVVPRAADGPLEFTVEKNKGRIEIDTTNRRLHSVKLDLTIHAKGSGPVSDGGRGEVRAEVRFIESQAFKD